jgi:hypothetical protein
MGDLPEGKPRDGAAFAAMEGIVESQGNANSRAAAILSLLEGMRSRSGELPFDSWFRILMTGGKSQEMFEVAEVLFKHFVDEASAQELLRIGSAIDAYRQENEDEESVALKDKLEPASR